MKSMTDNHNQEFQDLVGDIANSFQVDNEAMQQAMMLYTIAQEKKNTNLIVRNINAKLDNLLSRMDKLEEKIQKEPKNHNSGLSDRDMEVLEFVKKNTEVCAETLQEEFNYKGRNGASSRLHKLYKEGQLGKIYKGRKVYYIPNKA